MVRTYSYASDGAKFISPHFQIGEFKSFCDDWGRLTTDIIKIDDELPVMLEKLYEYLDNKYGVGYIYITSGYRSYDFEMYLAGFTGFHYEGKATDIMCYDKNNNLIAGSLVACACQTIGFRGIGYIGNAVHCDVRDYISWFDESKGCAMVSDFYDYFGIEKPQPPTPVERDTTKIQLEVVEPELNCRTGHDTLSTILGIIPTGVYNFIQYYEDGNYTWYEVEKDKWIANNGEWVRILNIEPILTETVDTSETKINDDSETKEEDSINIPEDVKTNGNEEINPDTIEIKKTLLLNLLNKLWNWLKKIFK